MKKFIGALAVGAVFATGLAVAGSERSEKIRIEIDDDSGAESLSLSLDSKDMGFSLSDIGEGESRSYVDADGRNILITRQEKGYKLNVDGRELDLPVLHGMEFMPVGEHALTIDMLEDQHHAMVMTEEFGDIDVDFDPGFTVIPGRKLDDATKQAIRDALSAAGISDEIRFVDIDGSGPHVVMKRVHSIKHETEL
ncbi:MAG: hypothetical protein AAF385_12055 [Pseudomonadota bacterium]